MNNRSDNRENNIGENNIREENVREENIGTENVHLELPFAYSAVIGETETFLHVAQTLPQLIDLLREREQEWLENQEQGEESQREFDEQCEVVGINNPDWSDLDEVVVRAHLNGSHSLWVPSEYFLTTVVKEQVVGEQLVKEPRVRERNQSEASNGALGVSESIAFAPADQIPVHWPNIEQQRELLSESVVSRRGTE